jgi:hypothetical protein
MATPEPCLFSPSVVRPCKENRLLGFLASCLGCPRRPLGLSLEILNQQAVPAAKSGWRKSSLERGGSPGVRGLKLQDTPGPYPQEETPGYLETSYYPHLHLGVWVPEAKTVMACTHLHSRVETWAVVPVPWGSG